MDKITFLKSQTTILQRKDLDALDKLVYSFIDFFTAYEGCKLSNTQLAEFLGCSSRSIIRSISKLKELDLISIEYSDQLGPKSNRTIKSTDNARTALLLFNKLFGTPKK